MPTWVFAFGAMLIALLANPLPASAVSYGVYTEGWGDGWASWSWNVTESQNTTTAYVFKGSKSDKVVYNVAWAGFAAGSWNGGQGYSTTGYRDLVFAVYNYSNGDDLWVTAQTVAGTNSTALRLRDFTDSGSITLGKWSWVRIPLTSFGLGSAPTLSNVTIQSSKAPAVVYFDEIGFSSNVTLYEGVGTVGTVNAPGTQLWYWGGSVSPTIYKDGTDYWFKFATTNTWGGVQFQERVGNLTSNNYGALAIRFRQSGSPSQQRLFVNLTGSSGALLGTPVILDSRYLPSTITFEGGEWYHVTIPLSDFAPGSTPIGGVAISTDTVYPFWIDDVRFVQKLAWPIPGVTRAIGGYHFGENWLNSCGGLMKLHSGSDYTDQADSGRAIYAASRGIVKQVNAQTGWGYAVVLQHESNFTTSYLHLNLPNVSVGMEVQRGALLGTTTALATGSHLHFGMRVIDYDSTLSQAGALPQTSCVINGFLYPPFANWFIDPEKMNW